jgi:hypothetical protein
MELVAAWAEVIGLDRERRRLLLGDYSTRSAATTPPSIASSSWIIALS